MNVFYEEEGTLKVASILADNDTSLQVEAPHGKRSKIKAASVLFRFEQPALPDFMPQAQRASEELDVDFLWECSSGDEFDYAELAAEYYGHKPAPVESAAVLLKLHGAPMYFYKRGRGRYRAAPAEALKAALASVERKKREAARKEAYVAQLVAGELPAELQSMLATLLYKPDRGTIEWKALEEASAQLKLTPTRVIERSGGLPSTHDYHLNRFLFEHFPRGAAFGAGGRRRGPGGLAARRRRRVQHRRRFDDRDRRCVFGDIARQRQHARSAFTSRRLRLASRQTLRSTRLPVRACRPSIFPAARSPCFRMP